jgi:hypothetical protein
MRLITWRTVSSTRIPTERFRAISRYLRVYGNVANRAVLKAPSDALH